MFEKLIIIDAKGHMMGRLAATVAKEILNGQRIVVVRIEEALVSGPLDRNLRDFARFRNKASNTNPWKGGPWHHRAPSKIFWRAVRGMTPHKTARGAAALGRLKIFEGCPHPYSHQKRTVVPTAMKCVILGNTRKYTTLKAFSTGIGWNKKELIEKLEAKRQERASQYWQNKVIISFF